MDVIKDLWKNKPLFIAVVVGLAAVFYIIYKSNGSNAAVTGTVAPDANASSGSSGSGATYVEENYSNYSPTTVSSSSPVTTPPVVTLPTILKPAGKGTLGKYGAGNGDTNFWVYQVPAGSTLTSVAEFAKWGTDFVKLANYRNNLQILKAAGVDTSNPYATIPTGLQLSV